MGVPVLSTDLRLKKLRGSGGYVIATVDDLQQGKGNLGGPDLFLAPIGRIDTSRISKFFCNTCESEYDGAPDIKYESPNEEVAENLILAEKGQYICQTCSSTLAEYREFKKSDEAADVGAAKPIEVADTVASEATEVADISIIEDAGPDTISAELPVPETEPESQPETGEIRSIIGMAIFDMGAAGMGTVKQIGIDATQTLTLVVERADGTRQMIAWDRVRSVGDIILLGEEGPAAAPSQDHGCPQCKFENKPDSKFCEQCGHAF